MAHAALVNTVTMEVENLGEVGVPEPVIDGHRFIYDTQWAVGQTPNIGQLWDGLIPASFANQTIAQLAVVATIDSAKAARELAIDQLVQANANFDAAVAAAS